MRRTTTRWLVAAAVLGLAVGSAGRAEAGPVVTFKEAGADVVMTLDGPTGIDLTGLTKQRGVGLNSGFIYPSLSAFYTGPTGNHDVDRYTGLNSPGPIGTGGSQHATSGTGDIFGAS